MNTYHDSRALPPVPLSTPNSREYPPQSTDMNTSLPTTPMNPTPQDPKPRKSNPLNDLIDTEKTYVEQLTGIIRKIAAAWSRSNLPPPELDTMFRCIEAIYKAEKTLLSKLNEIGTNPASPKALGDLLMRWIDDLETPYTNYCNKYCCGFDDWETVRSNRKLPDILASFSASNPPTSEQSIWTLDTLFLLPKARLKYYRKLYNRLLKGTVAGRSDHRLLLGALEKLDALLGVLESRECDRVGQPQFNIPPTAAGMEIEDGATDTRTQYVSDPGQRPPGLNADPITHKIGHPGTKSERTSDRESSATLTIPIAELERRLSTERTLDIFTMNPKAVRLQISPPYLTFTREMRFSRDVLVRFTPKATDNGIVHQKGHIFLLSDLLLVCEWMTPQEKDQRGPSESDLWLCYPPLAGKVLRTSEVEGKPHVLQIAVMKKEYLVVETDSVDTRNALMQHLKECIEFSSSLLPPSKEAPPPVPPLALRADNYYPPLTPSGAQNGYNDIPMIGDHSVQRYPSRQDSHPPLPQGLPRHEAPANAMSNLSLGPDARLQGGAHRTALLRNSNPSSIHPSGPSGQPVGYQPRPSSSSAVPQSQGYVNPRAAPLPSGPTFNYPYPDRPVPPLLAVQDGTYRPNGLPHRPPSDPPVSYGTVRKSSSMHSLASHYPQRERSAPQPPMPNHPADFARNAIPRVGSAGNLQATFARPLLPSAQMRSRAFSVADQSFDEPSPPGSPVEPIKRVLGPSSSTVVANSKCKVFLQQQHSQWKSLGSAKLKLYHESPTNVKQLVVESNKTVLISTIVLTDGVERVGKTGVAIELSDKGARTGVIYMLQLRDESSAVGLYNNLLVGSDRSG